MPLEIVRLEMCLVSLPARKRVHNSWRLYFIELYTTTLINLHLHGTQYIHGYLCHMSKVLPYRVLALQACSPPTSGSSPWCHTIAGLDHHISHHWNGCQACPHPLWPTLWWSYLQDEGWNTHNLILAKFVRKHILSVNVSQVPVASIATCVSMTWLVLRSYYLFAEVWS